MLRLFAVVLAMACSQSAFAQAANSSIAKPPTLKAGQMIVPNYPMAAMRNEEEGISNMELSIAADGHVTKCIAAGATPSLDAATCRLFSSLRYNPATNEAGQAVDGIVRRSMHWSLPK
jgi:outer membrane biosynthesis protein TonB